jgi:uncharacterized protein (DUF924 family)
LTGLPTAEILTYWFDQLGPEKWFAVRTSLDLEIRDKFLAVYENIRKLAETNPADFAIKSADDYLAAILLFDQFPRNMFRGTAQSFASDPISLHLARTATGRRLDLEAPIDRRIFFYLPFEHSEALSDQTQCIDLVRERCDIGDYMKYARLHFDIIQRFGRFPHRNKILGRLPTAEETAYLAEGGTSFGTSPVTHPQ